MRSLSYAGLALGLLASTAAAAPAVCTTVTDTANVFSNPSFESGDLTGWTEASTSGGSGGGQVFQGLAPDGFYFYAVSATTTWTYLSQAVTGIETGNSYTISFNYLFVYGDDSDQNGNCYIGVAQNNWMYLSPQQAFPVNAYADFSWHSGSLTWSRSSMPPLDSVTVYLLWRCDNSNVQLRLDNIRMPLTHEQCTSPSSSVVSPSASSSAVSSVSSSASSSASAVVTPPPKNPCKPKAPAAVSEPIAVPVPPA